MNWNLQRLAKLCILFLVLLDTPDLRSSAQSVAPFLQLMRQASRHALANGDAATPALSPEDSLVVSGDVPVDQFHNEGFKVIPWNPNEPDAIRKVIRLGVDGLISDRPDVLQRVLAGERASSKMEKARLRSFKVEGHRGARGLRPENTLPAFEAGLDNLIDAIETDTGVTTDYVSLIWHDQFLNPESCRKSDGTAYTMADRVFIRDISSHEAQASFICDKLHFGPVQSNDLALSPVSVAFASHEHLISPYVPTYVEQLFRFTAFYAEYYRNGPGRHDAQSRQRAAAAARVHFNLETKILPEVEPSSKAGDKPDRNPLMTKVNHTVDPQVFVDTLCGAIHRNHMESRSDVQSFDFRTLILVEEQYPTIPTYYLVESPQSLSTRFVPLALRQPPPSPH